MATLLDLDETLCKTPVCQHPQCWVTFRRLKLGHPRYRPLGSITRTSRMDPDGLPVLSVTTMPNNQTIPNERNVQGAPSLVTFSRLPSPSMYNLYNSASFSMGKILFPGMNSYSEITVASKRVSSFLSTKKPEKVATVDPCLQDLKTKHPRMVWVPNSQQKVQQQEKREKPLKVQIKELTFTDVAGQLRRENRDPDVSKIRKVNKPPTGGSPHNLILTRSPILTHTHARKWMTASSIKENREEIYRRSYEHHSYSESQHDLGPGSLSPENRRVVLHDSRSKHRSSPTISQSSPVYKLDEQNLEALDDLGIDLNRIRNQTYLWKKYIGLTGPSSRIQPPATGSVDCDTERSHDLDSRDSPSSTGFSQTSWTELEPSDAPLDLDSRKINEQDFPGEQTGEAESNPLQGDKNIPQEPPDFESEHLLRKEESPKENELPTNSEPISQDTEVTEGHNSSEQRVPSPQPNPPPPSPTQSGIN